MRKSLLRQKRANGSVLSIRKEEIAYSRKSATQTMIGKSTCSIAIGHIRVFHNQVHS